MVRYSDSRRCTSPKGPEVDADLDASFRRAGVDGRRSAAKRHRLLPPLTIQTILAGIAQSTSNVFGSLPRT